MAIFKIARFEVRPDAREQAERAMHDFASYVRKELPDSALATYREAAAPNRFISLIRADNATADERHRAAPGTKLFADALQPLVVGTVEFTEYELVTSSDLAPRHRRR